MKSRKPYYSLRETAKPGRFSDPNIIGSVQVGSKVVIIDDIITTGETKIRPYHICCEYGFNILCIIVPIDREEGWKKTFQENNIDVPVWAGISLSEIHSLCK